MESQKEETVKIGKQRIVDKFTKVGSKDALPTTNFVLKACTENALTILDAVKTYEEQTKIQIKEEIEHDRIVKKEEQKEKIILNNKEKLNKGMRPIKKKSLI